MNWRIVKHGDLLIDDSLRIALLKNQHWPYGLESQILWMNNNIRLDDVHLMGEEGIGDKIELRAYATLVNVTVLIDSHKLDCIGVGGVCVDKSTQNTGLGRLLMQKAAKYINEQEKMGILLCKESIITFYEKCGWKNLHYESSNVGNSSYKHNIMTLDKDFTCSNIVIDKLF